MKTLIRILLVIILSAGMNHAFSQDQPVQLQQEDTSLHMLIKNDGTRYVGKIIKQDAREVLIETNELGQIYIPRHEIREIREVSKRELNEKGEYVPGEVFATRYFITTNGLSIARKENYIIWNLYGPDIQFGVTDNLGLGIMTTWLGWPLVGTIKYSVPLGELFSTGAGLLVGTDTWGGSGFRFALPYGVLTYGNRLVNFNFSFGYGSVRYKQEEYNPNTGNYEKIIVNEGRVLMSGAGMFKAGKKVSVVFDTFIAPRGKKYDTYEWRDVYNPVTGNWEQIRVKVTKNRPGFALILPGLRFQTEPDKAFQFGFAGLVFDGETIPLPIPMLQWFRKL